jgi:hypothetical protein
MADPVAHLVAEIVGELEPVILDAIREFLIANEKEIYPIFRGMIMYEQELIRAAAVISPFTLITKVLGMILLRLLYITGFCLFMYLSEAFLEGILL